MEQFFERYGDRVKHVLSCPDRMLLRGTFPSLCRVEGMGPWLGYHRVLLKDFALFAQKQSDRLKEHAQAFARERHRPYEYLASSKISKQKRAGEIAERDGIREGLIAVFSCVESCFTFTVRKNREQKRIELARRESRCLYLYFYFIDREFGFMHVRLATWMPYDLQVCLNGQEWLARKMDRAGLLYRRLENCFADLGDPQKAQSLADAMLDTNWPRVLNHFAKLVNPILKDFLRDRSYYWTVREMEVATDLVFTDERVLPEIYPHLVHHAITSFGSQDVMRFLGHRLTRNFDGEVQSTLVRRSEGIRVKHQVRENWIKMYDKFARVLRIETTINQAKRFRAYRWAVRQGKRVKAWFALRKGVADMRRRVEICRLANARYLAALASVPEKKAAETLLDPVTRPVMTPTERFRPLRPIAPDEAKMFAGLLRGEWMLEGFTNRHLRLWLFPQAQGAELKKCSAQVTRRIRLLRAHGLLRKISKTRRYHVTPKGIAVMSTALNVRRFDVNALTNTG